MTGSSVSFSDKSSLLSDLRTRISGIERAGDTGRKAKEAKEGSVISLDAADMDEALPGGGLARGRLHEVAATGGKGKGARLEGDVAALGFAAALVGRSAGNNGSVLWCSNRKSLYHAGGLHGPGLSAFGVDARRLVLIDGADDTQVLWAMEEGLRSGVLGAVAGEVGNLTLTASRRLQLAAEAGGGLGLLVRVNTKKTAKTVTAATTRWEVSVSDGAGIDRSEEQGQARWDVRLARCRGGSERRWQVEWNHETHCFAVVAPVAGQSAHAGAATHAGEGRGEVVALPRRAVG
jgi:protein ImuA